MLSSFVSSYPKDFRSFTRVVWRQLSARGAICSTGSDCAFSAPFRLQKQLRVSSIPGVPGSDDDGPGQPGRDDAVAH